MADKFFDNKYRTTIICIDRYPEKIPKGRLYNCIEEGGIEFSGLVQLVLQMEKLLDSMKFPQPYNSMRTFNRQSEVSAQTITGKEHRGEIATFALKVLYRQNATWQGTLTWLETSQEESFRSVLEMVHLMDSALGN